MDRKNFYGGVLVLLFWGRLTYQSASDCDFLAQNAVCPLMVENVIDIETESVKMSSLEQCQYECFLDTGCHNFTYFANDVGKRCILFRHCHSTMPCMKCVSGPRMPPIMKCGVDIKHSDAENEIRVQNLEQKPGEPEITTFRPFLPNLSELLPETTKAPQTRKTPQSRKSDEKSKTNQKPRKPKQGFDGEGDDNTFDVEFIDDGLFGEEDEER